MLFLMATVMALNVMPEDRRAALLGTFDAMMDLGLAVGPLLCYSVLSITGFPVEGAFMIMALATGLSAPLAVLTGHSPGKTVKATGSS